MKKNNRVRYEEKEEKKNKRVTGITWYNARSIILTIPHQLARKHHLDKPCTIIFEDREDGILIKKFNP